MEQQTGYKLGKEYIKAVYWSTHLFNLYAEHIMWNDGLDEAQAGIKILRRNINNLMAESEEEQKNFLMRVKEESGKATLKLNIKKKKKKNKIMATGPITHGK